MSDRAEPQAEVEHIDLVCVENNKLPVGAEAGLELYRCSLLMCLQSERWQVMVGDGVTS